MADVVAEGLPVGIDVDERPVPQVRTCVVRGTVRNPDGSAVSGAAIVAVDAGLRSETPLGRATTGTEGTYSIAYTPEQLRPEGKRAADLIVRASDEAGNELARSELLCRAPAEAVVDLVAGNRTLRGPSEYDRLVSKIQPYLGDKRVGDLERDDVGFLACSAQVDRLQLATLVVAHQLARDTSLPALLFYAMGRQGVRLQLEAMALLRHEALRAALSAAVAANIVVLSGDDTVDSLLQRLQGVLLQAAFDRSRSGFSVGAVLATSLVTPELQQAFLASYVNRPASPEEFWKSLEEDVRFSREAVDDLRLTLLLGRVTGYQVPVLEQLKRLRQDGQVRSFRDLATLDRGRWREIVSAAAAGNGFNLPADIPGETPEDRLENYITSLRAPIESLLPSDSLRRALTAAPETDEPLRRFLANTPDLDLYWTNIDGYLGEHREAALSGIAAGDRETVIACAKRSQRLLRLTRRADQVRVLDAAGFDSAVAIARTPRRRFRQRFVEAVEQMKDTLDDAYVVTTKIVDDAGSESGATTLLMMNSAAPPDAVADAIYSAAASKAALHLEQYVNLKDAFEIWPGAIGGGEDQQKNVKKQAFKAVPDLETLFGSQSFCECTHCRSVYSPAAYLVDLLHELDDLTKKADGTLKYEDSTSVPGPIAVLLGRRPDIALIPLTCENTNTTLPYIDLVNEALESYIESHLDSNDEWTDATSSATPTIEAHDTGKATAEELRAVPQYVIPRVYEALARKAVYPMTLPFDRPLEAIRTYVDHLGTSRAEIMEAFRAGGPSQASDVALAIERLGTCAAQYQIITAGTSTAWPFDATDGGKNVWAYYGYGSAQDLSALVAVPELLRRTGLGFEELTALLQTRFINPFIQGDGQVKPVEISFPAEPGADACDVTRMTLVNVPDGEAGQTWFDRLHRFIRLWRALGWDMVDVDRAVAELGTTLDDITLQKIAAVKGLAVTLGQPVASLLALWADLDTWAVEPAESFYAKVLLNPAVVQDEKARQAFTNALSGPTGHLEDHVSAVAAAFAITSDDVERIRTHSGLAAQDAPLTVAALSTLYRYATLSKALGTRVRDLITLLRLVPASMHPFAAADPRPAATFVQVALSVAASAFPIPLLNYLFRNEPEPTRHPAPTRAFVKTTLETLQKGLAAIHQDLLATEQPPADILRARLEQAAKLLDKTLDVPQGVDKALAVLDPRQTTFGAKPLTVQDRMAFVNDHFTAFLATPGATLFGTPLPDPANVDDAEQRFLDNVKTVLNALVPWLRRTLQELFVVGTMADAMGTDQAIMQWLLAEVLDTKQIVSPTRTALEYLLGLVAPDGALSDLELETDPPKPPTLIIQRVFKAAAYVNAFAMTEPELELFTTSPLSPLRNDAGTATLVLALNELPVVDVTPASSTLPGDLFDVWRALRIFYELRDALPRSEKTLVDYFRAGDSEKPALLQEATGADATQTGTVNTGLGASALPATVPGLVRLHRAITLLKRVGATPAQMFDWAATTADHQQAESIVQTVKARYERARWLDVARALNDPLREKQRNALVAFLIPRLSPAVPIAEWPHPVLKFNASGAAVKELQQKLNAAQTGDALVVDGKFGPLTRAAVIAFQKAAGLAADGIVNAATWAALDRLIAGPRTADELLEFFLIDVQMNSRVLTSRIKQAISSVQLFVQRCLLNLEPGVSPEEIDPDHWEWMKHYRIWEANRKVFLYPETYILPELRDDKTPFFKELETELLQNELTDQTIEKAFVDYLHKLDAVARLDIRAFCRQGDGDREIFHVFGRTWNAPHVYYYRRGTFTVNAGAGTWTAWEPLNVDIEGDHLVPLVWNRRVYLYWALFNEVSRPKDQEGVPVGDEAGPFADWAIGLAWSERRDIGWSPPQKSKGVIRSKHFWVDHDNPPPWKVYSLFFPGQETHYFKPTIDATSLTIEVFRRWSEYSDKNLYVPAGTVIEGGGGADSQGHQRLGTFVFASCRGEATVKEETADLGYSSLEGPQATVNQFMEFRSEESAIGLVFQDTAATTVLASGSDYALLPDPQLKNPAKLYYPFTFEDGERTYFARPLAAPLEPMLQMTGAGDAIKHENVQVTPLDHLFGPNPVEHYSAITLGVSVNG